MPPPLALRPGRSPVKACGCPDKTLGVKEFGPIGTPWPKTRHPQPAQKPTRMPHLPRPHRRAAVAVPPRTPRHATPPSPRAPAAAYALVLPRQLAARSQAPSPAGPWRRASGIASWPPCAPAYGTLYFTTSCIRRSCVPDG